MWWSDGVSAEGVRQAKAALAVQAATRRRQAVKAAKELAQQTGGVRTLPSKAYQELGGRSVARSPAKAFSKLRAKVGRSMSRSRSRSKRAGTDEGWELSAR